MHLAALCLALLTAPPAAGRLFEDETPRPPGPQAASRPADPDDLHAPDPAATVKGLTPPPVTAPPPLVVQFHEDAATKGDLAAMADRIERAIKPLDARLVAVEQRADTLARDVAALKVARQSPPAAKASAPPPPPRTQLWELYDITGMRCTGRDPDELSARVQARDAHFTRKAATAQATTQPTYASMPMDFGGISAPMSFGGMGGGWSFGGGGAGGGGMVGSFGGGYSSGCAGGSCR